MKRLIVVAASIALMTGIGTANAKPGKKGVYSSQGTYSQRNVRLGRDPTIGPPNADLKYGPQPDYPQSPPGAAADARLDVRIRPRKRHAEPGGISLRSSQSYVNALGNARAAEAASYRLADRNWHLQTGDPISDDQSDRL